MEMFDLILCRNVLIYQNVENKKIIIQKIIDHLTPDGCFVLGSGEGMMGLSTAFNLTPTDGVILYRLKSQFSTLKKAA